MRIDGLSRSSSIPAIERSARDFEAMAIGNLIKPMFDTVDTAHGPFGGGDGEDGDLSGDVEHSTINDLGTDYQQAFD